MHTKITKNLISHYGCFAFILVILTALFLFPILSEAQTRLFRNLYLGTSGSDVSAIQHFLKTEGHFTFPTITGYFGLITQKAVQKWQCEQGIVCSGTPSSTGYGNVGPRTRAALISSTTGGNYDEIYEGFRKDITPSDPTIASDLSPSGQTPISSTGQVGQIQTFTRNLNKGTVGVDVIALQTFLNNTGDFTYPEITGYFGTVTEEAVRKYQCRELSLCQGNQNTNGYGALGPLTRAKINTQKLNSSNSTVSLSQSQTIPPPSIVYRWISGAWSFCSNNTQTRSLWCSGSDGDTYPDYNCTDSRPLTSRSCSTEITVPPSTTELLEDQSSQLPCTFNGKTILHGDQVTYYEASSVESGQSCKSQSRACDNGTLNGSYEKENCSVTGSTPTTPTTPSTSSSESTRSCSIAGMEIPHGKSVTLFKSKNVASGKTCGTVDLVRKCTDGKLSGNTAFRYPYCVANLPVYNRSDIWAYHWSGAGNPNTTVVPYLDWWDVPHGDDYDDYNDPVQNCRAHYDTPSRGFFTIDLIKTPKGSSCPLTRRGESPRTFTGFILKRDPVLDNTNGLTIEFRLQLKNHNAGIQDGAVSLQLLNKFGNIGLHFSLNCTQAGSIGISETDRHKCSASGTRKAANVNNLAFNTYRVVVQQNSTNFDLYVNNKLLIKDAKGGSAPGSQYEAPVAPGKKNTNNNNRAWDGSYLLLGDTSSQETVKIGKDISGAFTLDFIRYTTGPYAPSKSIPKRTHALDRKVWKNPNKLSGTMRGLVFDEEVTLAKGYIKQSSYVSRIPTLDTLSSSRYNKTINGTIVDGSRRNLLVLRKPDSIVGNDGWQIDLKLKIGPKHEDRAFYMLVMDTTGTNEVLFSRRKVELRMGSTFHSYSLPVSIDTSEYHTYTLFKPRGKTSVNLYIDDDPNPVVSNFKSGLSQLNDTHSAAVSSSNEMQINLGAASLLPSRPDASFGASTKGVMDVDLESIKWRRFGKTSY
jgi:peptidoglycan hydrolase-like protein with peptidoglycan-binding domain